jgi:hypothetical protein
VAIVLIIRAIGSRLDVVVFGSDTMGKLMVMLFLAIAVILVIVVLLAKAGFEETIETLQAIARTITIFVEIAIAYIMGLLAKVVASETVILLAKAVEVIMIVVLFAIAVILVLLAKAVEVVIVMLLAIAVMGVTFVSIAKVVAIETVILLAKAVEVMIVVLLAKAVMALALEGSSNAPNAEASTVLSMKSLNSKAVAMSLMIERSFAIAGGALLVNNRVSAVATMVLAETFVDGLFETVMATAVRFVKILLAIATVRLVKSIFNRKAKASKFVKIVTRAIAAVVLI